jgi:hypothetical protein
MVNLEEECPNCGGAPQGPKAEDGGLRCSECHISWFPAKEDKYRDKGWI